VALGMFENFHRDTFIGPQDRIAQFFSAHGRRR
jgi:hypothetical protein